MNKKDINTLKNNEFVMKFIENINSLPDNEREDIINYIKDAFSKNNEEVH